MPKGNTNVERLVAAGVLDDSYLTDDGRDAINGIKLTDQEIDNLKAVKEKLNLGALTWDDPKHAVTKFKCWQL
jgi:hypothetical protein